MKDWAAFIQNCDQEIRAGLQAGVARKLSDLNFKKIPRAHRLALAQLCRRSGQVASGLRLLSGILRPVHAIASPASPEEQAEYALLLQRTGPVQEALALLRGLDPLEVPQAPLYEAYCLFNDWDYSAAIPRLELYLTLQKNSYQHLIGEVNLASALLADDNLSEAGKRLESAEAAARQEGALRLLRNCHEMRAQLAILRGEWTEAQTRLDAALEGTQSPTTLDQLYALKWRAALESFRARDPVPLLKFRSTAVANGDAETLRDTDLLLLKLQYDPEKFQFLYFGTPFAAYRKRLRKMLPESYIADSFTLNSNGQDHLDLINGLVNGTEEIPQGILQLLRALTADFYRPRVTGSIFEILCQGEYFDINSSPNRIHQALRRARRWLEGMKLNVALTSVSDQYRIQAEPQVRVTVAHDYLKISPEEVLIQDLMRTFSDCEFTAQEARTALKLTPHQFKELAARAKEEGTLLRYGAGPKTVYYFAKKAA